MTPFGRVVSEVGHRGLTLVRAHPRADRLHLDLRDEVGHRVIGQWIADAGEAERIMTATQRVAPGQVERLGGHLVLQHGGADRRLTALAPLVAAGAELVVHRPERRAVVRATDGDQQTVWTKVVRSRRAADLVRRMRAAAAVPGLTAPDVTAWDEQTGTIALSTLPGTPLHDLLTGDLTDDVAAGVGRAVATLHGATGPALDGATTHRPSAEVEVEATLDLLDLARRHRALTPREANAIERDIAQAATRIMTVGPPPTPALTHRDLHDKQLLVDGDRVGMLDVDMLAPGDPALDLGNLLAHLDLRVAQGWTTEATARRVADGVLEAHAPDGRTATAAQAYRSLTHARLRALYAFRPGDASPAVRIA
ncbi:MAG: aminoglycoside phosphotransferase family protein [Janibacter sp.]|nr:aminoglycoside phosphotransferase family protein [Janibacter sp.]